MVQKKRLDDDTTRDQLPRDLAPDEVESELPPVEAEVGGEGTIEIVAEHTRDEEMSSSVEQEERERDGSEREAA